MKDLLAIIDESDLTCFHSYRRIAEKLMNDYVLKVKDKFYRIVECEFYFHSKNHEDPYVHGHPRQKESIGEWYFHGSGLDITLSNGESFGGILLRGIARIVDRPKPDRDDAIIGPLNVCTEIFKQFGNVLANNQTDFGLIDISNDKMNANMIPARIFSFPRINLNSTKDNDGKFCRRPYRFVSFLHLPHKEADKMKKYLLEEASEPLNLVEYKEYYKGDKW